MAKAFVALIVCLCVFAPCATAAQVQPNAATAQPKPVRPAWSELTPAQHQVLAPLQEDWASLDATRRKKWVTIANRYPKMKPQEQERLQARMKEWANLTPEQRRVAREKYLAIRKMPPEKRQELRIQWEEYQASLAARTPDDQPSGDAPSPAQ
jgi:hypothetical protein